jgi:SAM-dependent methyltransferase
MRTHRVRVSPLPVWLDSSRLLGDGTWRTCELVDGGLAFEAELPRDAAADLEARLRGVGLAGAKLAIEIAPPLPRSSVRAARTAEARRYRHGSPGFTRAGARVDEEARRSLTPEALAHELGRRAHARGAGRVLDATCGAGGNAIGFARAGCRVTAIDLDRARLADARHNAALFGVERQIEFVCGDVRDLVPQLQGDLLFIDPPWGARYDKQRVALTDLPLLSLLLDQRTRFAHCWAKVPPSFDPRELGGASAEAVFGVSEGDARRVKFLLLDLA